MSRFVNSRLFFIVFMAVLIVSLTGLSLDSVRWRTFGVNDSYVTIYQIGLFLFGITVSFVNKDRYKDSSTSIINLFCFLCLLASLINGVDSDYRSLMAMLFNILVIPIGLASGKYIMENIEEKSYKDIWFLLLQIPSLFVGITLLGVNFKFDSDCAFAFFLYMPLVFFISKNPIKIPLLVFYGVLILLAGKRSIFVAYVMCMGIYFLHSVFEKNDRTSSKNAQRLLLVIVLLGSAFWLYYNNIEQFDYIGGRFSNIRDDGGSGRDEVYASILGAFESSDLISQLFGHGYSSVLKTFQVGAHNDLLEILYDYGFLAVFTYVIFLIKLVLYTFHLRRYHAERIAGISYILIINISIIIILGLLNCMVASTIFNFTNFIALGATLKLIQIKQ